MEYVQEITLELNSNTAYTTLGAKQGDADTRVVKVSLTQDGQSYTIDPGVSAYFRFRKPDGKAIVNRCTIQDNKIHLVLTKQTLAVAGRGYGDITLQSGTEILSTVSFILIIMASPQVSGEVVSSNEFGELTEVVADANNIIYEAEAWAAGTRGGKEVLGGADPVVTSVSEVLYDVAVSNWSLFFEKLHHEAGVKRTFTFTYQGTSDEAGAWQLITEYQNGNTISTSDAEIIASVEDYGITYKILGGQSNPAHNDQIVIVINEQDSAYENNAKYYSDKAKESKEAIDNLGTTGEKIRAEEFCDGNTYNENDYVWYEGSLFRFIENHEPGEWNQSEVKQEAIVTKTNTPLDPEDFNSATTYYIGDYVKYDDKIYKFIVKHNAGPWDAEDVTYSGDEAANFHFKIPQGPTGTINFMTFDVNTDTGYLWVTIPDVLNPHVSFNNIGNDGCLYVEIDN